MSKLQGTSLLHINDLRSWSNSTEIVKDGLKTWVHARPIGDRRLSTRLYNAIKVFRGEADAVIWEQQ